ncbi:MAG: peroxiredoxin-like family protein [Myxococcota bacterium]
MAGFRSRQDELKALGVTLAFIGNGTPAMAEDFKQSLGLEVPVFTDPSRRTYAQLGFKRGPLSVVSPGVLASAVRAWRAGFRQTKTQGDPVQQGGVVVVRAGGAAEYGFASAAAGDHPPLDVVMDAARRAAR